MARRRRASATATVPASATPTAVEPGRAPIGFQRDEVADICGALALGGALLYRLGLRPEAERLEVLFGSVRARLAGQPLGGVRLVGQRERVDAVALPGSVGPSGKTWPRWPPHRAQRISVRRMPKLRSDRSTMVPADRARSKLGQPVPGVELGVGVEQLGAAPGAAEHALAVDVEQLARPGRLGAGPAQHGVTIGGELLLPLLLGLGDLVARARVLSLSCLRLNIRTSLSDRYNSSQAQKYFAARRRWRRRPPGAARAGGGRRSSADILFMT